MVQAFGYEIECHKRRNENKRAKRVGGGDHSPHFPRACVGNHRLTLREASTWHDTLMFPLTTESLPISKWKSFGLQAFQRATAASRSCGVYASERERGFRRALVDTVRAAANAMALASGSDLHLNAWLHTQRDEGRGREEKRGRGGRDREIGREGGWIRKRSKRDSNV